MSLWKFQPTFWRILYFCSNNGPLPNVIFSALYFKHSLLNWRLKCMEITECLQNYRFYQTIISNYSSEVKLIVIDIRQLLCCILTLRKGHIFRLPCGVIPLLTKTRIICSIMINIYNNLLSSLKIWCLGNVQIFIDLS